MAIDRTIWNAYHSRDELPLFKCPVCQTGTLLPKGNSVEPLTPEHILRHQNHSDWHPDWDVSTWSEVCKCSNKECGQSVHLSGKAEAHKEPVEDLEHMGVRTAWVELLKIETVYPAPFILPLSDKLPQGLWAVLKSSFSLYWSDQSACLNRLRTAVELLLDDQNISRVTTTAKGKTRRLNLDQRIKLFAQNSNLLDCLDGLRNIGNLATHDFNKVHHEDALDAYDVIHHVLREVYDLDEIKSKSKKLKAKNT